MRLATKEEIENIRHIAEQKLLIYKERTSLDEYQRVLSIAMGEIASDMGIMITNNQPSDLEPMSQTKRVFEIRNRADLKSIAEMPRGQAPMHLIVVSEFDTLSDLLDILCREGKVYSLFTRETSPSITDFAAINDWVPLFIVRDAQEALSLIEDIHRDPFRTVVKAVNGRQVGDHYLAGCRT